MIKYGNCNSMQKKKKKFFKNSIDFFFRAARGILLCVEMKVVVLMWTDSLRKFSNMMCDKLYFISICLWMDLLNCDWLWHMELISFWCIHLAMSTRCISTQLACLKTIERGFFDYFSNFGNSFVVIFEWQLFEFFSTVIFITNSFFHNFKRN